MSELANYSIETDHLVWLSFKDGRSFRVPVGQLPRYLTPRDLIKVRRAMNLRHDFFRQHMPRTLVAFATVGVLAIVAGSGQVLAGLWHQPKPVAPDNPRQTEIVRNLSQPSSRPSAVPSPASGSVVAAPKPHAAARVRPVASIKPVAPAILSSPSALVTPIATPPISSPAPSPTPDPSPSPVPSPTPPAGQVLGDSTEPGVEPAPSAIH